MSLKTRLDRLEALLAPPEPGEYVTVLLPENWGFIEDGNTTIYHYGPHAIFYPLETFPGRGRRGHRLERRREAVLSIHPIGPRQNL